MIIASLIFFIASSFSFLVTSLHQHSHVQRCHLSILKSRSNIRFQTSKFSSTDENTSDPSNSKGRRRRLRNKSRDIETDKVDAVKSTSNMQEFMRESKVIPPPVMSFQAPRYDNFDITAAKSKLAPVRGTTADIQSEFQEKNVVWRYLQDLSKPSTIPGEEPKSVQLIKAVTWFGVIALVLVEIFVSIKTGGGPPPGSTANSATSFPTLDQLSYPSDGSTPQ